VPGGQGVAGSNPVVPTADRSPLFLAITPGQRAFLITCGGRVVDLGCGVWGPFVDHLWTPRGFRGATRAGHGALYPETGRSSKGCATPVFGGWRRGPVSRSVSGPGRGDDDFLYGFKPGRHGPNAPPLAPASARSRSAPRARRAAGARHGLPRHECAAVASGRRRHGLCGAAPPASSPLRVPIRPAPPLYRLLSSDRHRGKQGHVRRGRTDRE
jgi:hypothetical protein